MTATNYKPAPAIHQAFTRIDAKATEKQNAQFSELVLDICNGIQTALQLVHSSNLERELNSREDQDDQRPAVLDTTDTERLLLLATASAGLLAQAAERNLSLIASKK